MKPLKRYAGLGCAFLFLFVALLGCKQTAKQPDWPKGKKIAGSEQRLSHISGLVVDDKFAYVTMGGTVADQNAGTNGLRKVALESGAVTNLDSERVPQSDLGGMALDDQFVYWNAEGKIMRTPKAGGKPEVVAADKVGIGIDLVIDNDKVYWANHGYYSANSPTRPSPIYAVAKKGGPVEAFSVDQNIPHSLVADEKFIYWVTPTSIVKQAKAGGTAQAIYQASDKEGVDELAQDADNLYFGWRGAGESRWALRKISKQGGEPQTIVKRYSVTQVAVDDTNIFFFDEAGMTNDVLCRVAKNGGEVTKLDFGYASGVITQSKTMIYIAAGDDIFSFPK
jgi:hypothetical protein